MIVGEGKTRDELINSAQALGIAENVEFKGFSADVRGLMSACDAIIVPSLKEGFGLAAVEAMALSRPVITSNVGGLPEIVVPGETGFLVPADSPQQIADAMEKLIMDKQLVYNMGKSGRSRAQSCFDLKKQIKAVSSILEGYVK
jgi:glycosyltransferase involved in cell wall biosynthesis